MRSRLFGGSGRGGLFEWEDVAMIKKSTLVGNSTSDLPSRDQKSAMVGID
jgi:hypothetical protein